MVDEQFNMGNTLEIKKKKSVLQVIAGTKAKNVNRINLD